MSKNPFSIGKLLYGQQIILDHQVFSNKRTEYIYVALEDIQCFAIRKLFINEVLLADKPELKCALRHGAMLNYDFNIRRPLV